MAARLDDLSRPHERHLANLLTDPRVVSLGNGDPLHKVQEGERDDAEAADPREDRPAVRIANDVDEVILPGDVGIGGRCCFASHRVEFVAAVFEEGEDGGQEEHGNDSAVPPAALGDASLLLDGLDRVRRSDRDQLVLLPALLARLQLGVVHWPPVAARDGHDDHKEEHEPRVEAVRHRIHEDVCCGRTRVRWGRQCQGVFDLR
mmetsp:Transcript_32417/g.103733  ORF Transcript_32417/g.103733 Transcript_32417/m.103733 type:complete len:204 (-) Transcript_32417:463-1074(-)